MDNLKYYNYISKYNQGNNIYIYCLKCALTTHDYRFRGIFKISNDYISIVGYNFPTHWFFLCSCNKEYNEPYVLEQLRRLNNMNIENRIIPGDQYYIDDEGNERENEIYWQDDVHGKLA